MEIGMETGKVIEAAIAYFENDIRRISHLLKVYGFAKAIGEKEQLDLFTMECLETAAVLHDIGIKISEEKYQSSAGKYQELEGPPVAAVILKKLEFPAPVTERPGAGRAADSPVRGAISPDQSTGPGAAGTAGGIMARPLYEF